MIINHIDKIKPIGLELTTAFGSYNNQLNTYVRVLVDGHKVRFPLEEGVIKNPDMIETTEQKITEIVNGIIPSNSTEQDKVDALFFEHILNKTTPIGIDTLYLYLWDNNISYQNSLNYLNQLKFNLSEMRYSNNTLIMSIDDNYDNIDFINEMYSQYKYFKSEYKKEYEQLKEEELGYILIELLCINGGIDKTLGLYKNGKTILEILDTF